MCKVIYLFLGEGEPVYAWSGFGFAEEIIQQFSGWLLRSFF